MVVSHKLIKFAVGNRKNVGRLYNIWIERNGEQCVEIAESELSAKDNEMLVAAINRHWKFINEQITRTFNGEKTIAIDIEK